jgi:hypothetical protein
VARIRTIKPEFFTNSTTGRLSGQATKLYLGLQNHSDDYGVIRCDVAQFKAVVMPYEKSERVVDKALAELERAGPRRPIPHWNKSISMAALLHEAPKGRSSWNSGHRWLELSLHTA